MYRKQLTFQRVVCFISLIAGALLFVYSLGILTDIYDTLYTMVDEANLDSPKVAGARIYFDMQPFNRLLLRISLGLILCSCLLFITNTHSRRKYYVANLVATAINAVASFAAAVWTHLRVEEFKNIYLTTVDFENLEKRLARKGTYTDSTFWFDIHYLVCGILILAAVLLIVNYLWKNKVSRGERELLASSGKAAKA